MKLRDVRAVFRLIGELRELGADPTSWRPHMVRRFRKLVRAEIVVSSEVHLRPLTGSSAGPGNMRITDIGWGCNGNDEDHVWRIHNESDGKPDAYMLSLLGSAAPTDTTTDAPAEPATPFRGGKFFVLSQFPLPHLGAVDQLGVHREWGGEAFTPSQQRLIRLFHCELGRLWKKEALKKAADPNSELPPRLAQTLAALQAGCSEKEVSQRLSISPHTVHNYVKALHQRLGVSSRGELLAKAKRPGGFLPKLSIERTGPADVSA